MLVFEKRGKLDTLGARDFSSAVSGFCQVFIVARFAAREFGLRPKMCRPSANTENSRCTREKSLVPRVKTGVPAEKPLAAKERNINKLNPHMASTLAFEPGPHWWKASALTTAPYNLRSLDYDTINTH